MLSQPDCPVISRLGRLEEVDGVGLERLSLHPGVPKDRDLRFDFELRRAVISVPSNIAEGQGRLSTGKFRQFLGNARGSLMEVETQILVAQDLGYLEQNQSQSLLSATAEVGRILNGLLASLPKRSGQ